MHRSTFLVPAATLLVMLLAVPVFAGQPSAPPGQAKEKKAETPITLHGKIAATTAAGGGTTYTLTDGGTTYTLEAGPTWFFGDNHPLKPFVGKNVTIEGEIAAGTTEVDVKSVDGTALRAEGKPAWAGGWKVVGSIHPGWSQEKADRFKEKFGDCWPPGHCGDKAKPGKPDKPDKAEQPGDGAEPEASEEPEESEAPEASEAPESSEPVEPSEAPATTEASS